MFVKGQSGNPTGRKPGTWNRIRVLEEAILIKAKALGLDQYERPPKPSDKQRPKPAKDKSEIISRWIATLPDHEVAGMYRTTLPQKVDYKGEVAVTFEQWAGYVKTVEEDAEDVEE